MSGYTEYKKETSRPEQSFRICMQSIGNRLAYQWRDDYHKPYNKVYSDGTTCTLEIVNLPSDSDQAGWVTLNLTEHRADAAGRQKSRTISVHLGPEAKKELMRYIGITEQPTYRENGTMDPCSSGRFMTAMLTYPGSRVSDFTIANGVRVQIPNDDLLKAYPLRTLEG